MDINSIVLTGTIKKEKYSHSAHGLQFREIIIECKRHSGVKDIIKVVYQDNNETYLKGQNIKVYGTIRSRREDGRLNIYVFAEIVEVYDGEDINELVIEAHVCSEPYYKETKFRKITQMLICCENIRKAYASVIIWKKANIEIGQKIVICGRLQSRKYRDRIVNEISAYKYE